MRGNVSWRETQRRLGRCERSSAEAHWVLGMGYGGVLSVVWAAVAEDMEVSRWQSKGYLEISITACVSTCRTGVTEETKKYLCLRSK